MKTLLEHIQESLNEAKENHSFKVGDVVTFNPEKLKNHRTSYTQAQLKMFDGNDTIMNVLTKAAQEGDLKVVKVSKNYIKVESDYDQYESGFGKKYTTELPTEYFTLAN